MTELPSGTVIFLFTDLEGSTRLWEEHPDAMPAALVRHDEIVRGAVEDHGGVVFSEMGDGMAAAFSSPAGALSAAVRTQCALQGESWGEVGVLRSRMGLHAGEGALRADGQYVNAPLNRCARLMAVAHGGQVVVSDSVEGLVRDGLAPELTLTDLGEHRLRDLAQPVRVFQLNHPGLPHEFPRLRSLDAFPGNLPLQVSSFVGRERELTRVVKALDDARVVTLTGVGGVGKTRLALQVAAEVLPRFREGAWLVELAPVRDLDGVADAFATVFGVSARAGQTVEESLVDFLRTKQLLLVVDNCEHVLETVADLVETLERSCAGLVVLATSREGLALDGEQNLTVPSLAAPAVTADLETIAQSDAVDLFVQRAQRSDADFALTSDNAAAVVEVCRRLDGVPLALELAAARVTTMSPAELARGLDRRFDTLAGGRRRAVQRHQTLRAAIDWSYDLCSEPERRLLPRMSVFAGGATRAAVEAVCAGDPIDGRAVFELLAGLVAQSLVVVERDGPDTRYRLLETIREYGEERLADRDETETVRARHAEFFREFARAASAEMQGPHQVDAGRRFAAEHENLLSALNFAVDRGDVDVALGLLAVLFPNIEIGYRLLAPTDALELEGASEHPLYPLGLAIAANNAALRGDRIDAERLCDEAMVAAQRPDADPDRLAEEWVCTARASLAFSAGAFLDAARLSEAWVEVVRPTGRLASLAGALAAAATWHTIAGDSATALPLATEGLAVARRVGAPSVIGLNLSALAGAVADTDPDRAAALLHEDIEHWGTLGYESSSELVNATLICGRIRDWSTALELAPGAIRHLHWTGDRPQLAGILNILARVLEPNDAEAAAVLQGAARRIATTASNEPVTTPPVPVAPDDAADTSGAHTPRTTGFIADLRRETTGLLAAALGEERLHALRAQGEAMDTDDVVAYALDAAERAGHEPVTEDRVTELPSGTVTFLFTDIEGSTRLWEEFPDAMRDALARHDELLREAIETHGGHVVKTTGDGCMAAFATADEGVSAAIAAQRALATATWGETGALRVRMGLHTGVASLRDGDYFGTSLNRAARLMGVAHGGQVVCSQATTDLARDVLAEGVEFADLGEHRLRDLSRAERVFQVCAAGLTAEFAALTSVDAFPGNLPQQVSSFIGREWELEQTVAALTEARVVTLTGVGGVGKTRLALRVAAEVLPRFREGAWLAELAPVRDPEAVVDAVAAVFRVSARAGQTPVDALVEFLATKQLLLVVDNCEHVLDPVADLVDEIGRSCSGVVVLATSREGLAIVGERILAVPSLGSPAADAEFGVVAASDAVQLFLDRAQAADRSFTLGPDNAASVVRVCRRLDGVPLAIELAAARVSMMSPTELASALDHRFEVLAGGRRGAVKRQQTLRATIDWSYDLLDEAQQRLLARMAVFAGGSTREAAETVCSGAPIDGRDVFGLLAGLVAQSLVDVERDGPDTRYRLLETIREYGEERLAEHAETDALRLRHAEYYRDFAEGTTDAMAGPHQVEAGRRFAAEHENLLSAMSFAVDRGDVDLALALLTASCARVEIGYQLHLPTDALRLDGALEHPLYPLGLAMAAHNASLRGDSVDAERLCEEAVAAKRRLGADPDRLVDDWVATARQSLAFATGAFLEAARISEEWAEIGRAHGRLVTVALGLAAAATWYSIAGDPDTALPLATEGLAAARRLGTPSLIGLNLAALAGALADRDPDRASTLLHEDIERWESLGYENAREVTSAVLISSRIGEWPTVLELAPRAIRHLHWIGDRPQLAGVLNILARALSPIDPESAAVIQGAARRIATSVADESVTSLPASVAPGAETSTPTAHTSSTAGFIADLRRETTGLLAEGLGNERLHALRAQGEAMDIDEVAAYALAAAARATVAS